MQKREETLVPLQLIDIMTAPLQAVSAECEISNFDLQPSFSECLEFVEGDPCEDSRQSKKPKVLRATLFTLPTLDIFSQHSVAQICSPQAVPSAVPSAVSAA